MNEMDKGFVIGSIGITCALLIWLGRYDALVAVLPSYFLAIYMFEKKISYGAAKQ